MFVPHVSPYSQIDDGFPVRQGMGLPRDGVFDERELLADQQAHQNSGGIPLQHPRAEWSSASRYDQRLNTVVQVSAAVPDRYSSLDTV